MRASSNSIGRLSKIRVAALAAALSVGLSVASVQAQDQQAQGPSTPNIAEKTTPPPSQLEGSVGLVPGTRPGTESNTVGNVTGTQPQEEIQAGADRTSMSAESPFTDYTRAVVIYVLMVGVLVAALLILGLMVVNLGMMSKRDEDRVGGRTPSDVGILKGNVWPEEHEDKSHLPAGPESSRKKAA